MGWGWLWGSLWGDLPESEKRAVRIPLECFLVKYTFSHGMQTLQKRAYCKSKMHIQRWKCCLTRMACSRYVYRHISLLIPADDSRLINEKNSPCSRLHQHTFSHKCSKTSIRVTTLPYCSMNLWYDHSWTDLSNKLLFHVFVKPVDYIVIRSDGSSCKTQPMQFIYFIEKFAYISTVVA